MPNLTRADVDQANNSLISYTDGTPVTTAEHRSMNEIMLDFINSFLPLDAVVNESNQVVNDDLVNRDVDYVLLPDSDVLISSNGFSKLNDSDTLDFTPPIALLPLNTIVSIYFKRPS